MKIQDINGNIGPPKKLDKDSVADIRQKKLEKKKSASDTPNIAKSDQSKTDQVHISSEAQELQRSGDEIGVSKELLAQLPSSRAHVIYEALAKIKAGLYSSDKVVEEAAHKLLNSGELDDIVKF